MVSKVQEYGENNEFVYTFDNNVLIKQLIISVLIKQLKKISVLINILMQLVFLYLKVNNRLNDT